MKQRELTKILSHIILGTTFIELHIKIAMRLILDR